jgi:hypothetical protein
MPRYGAELSDDGMMEDAYAETDKPSRETVAYDFDLDHSDEEEEMH